jgi:transposase
MVSVRVSEVKIDNSMVIAAIDLAKEKNVAYARRVQGNEMKPIHFGHTRKEYQRLYDTVMRFAHEQGCEKVIMSVESTSVYGIPLSHFLIYKPIKLVLVNTYHTKKAKEIADNTPGKTDKKDTKVMADLVQLGRFLSLVIPEGVAADLRHLVHARERALGQLNRLFNQLHDLIFLVFP